MVIDGYNKKTLDTSSIQINNGYVKSKVIDEDIYAMGIHASVDYSAAVLQAQLLTERNKDLIEITKDLRKFLNRIPANSYFVKQIQNVVRMGQDLVNISVEIINESDSSEEIIKKLIPETTDDSSDSIDTAIDKAAEDTGLIPPLPKEEVIAIGKEVAKETKEEAKGDIKEANTVINTTPAPPAPTVAEVKAEIEAVAKEESKGIDKVDPNGIKVDVDINNNISEIIKGGAVITVGSAGSAAFEGVFSYLSYLFGGTFAESAGIGAAAGAGAPIAAAAVPATLIGIGAVLLDNSDIKAAAEKAIPKAADAYLQVLANGGSRKDAIAAAQDAIRNTEVRPELNEGGMYTPAVTLADKDSKHNIEDAIIKAIENEVGHAIERAGGDVSAYFGGCGCDDECDCPDCGCDDSDCSDSCPDCGCNDSGCVGYTWCDTGCVPDCGCDDSTSCENDSTPCENDSTPGPTPCDNDSHDSCSNDGYCDCGCDDSVCGPDGA